MREGTGTAESVESLRHELRPSCNSPIPACDAGLDNDSTPRAALSARTAPLSAPTHSRTRSQDRRAEPLGLHVVHDPGPGKRSVDIIFVHGLGGTSRLSWSWNRDLSLFWPKEWLPLEQELEEARALTFGYNAHFMSPNKDTFNISDFAKDLRMQMKFGNDSDVQSLKIGKLPLIFVVHSMGGLVVKKAYILGIPGSPIPAHPRQRLQYRLSGYSSSRKRPRRHTTSFCLSRSVRRSSTSTT